MKAWPVFAVLVLQGILFLGHWFVYSTFVAFTPGLSPALISDLRVTIFTLSFTFVVATLLAFRFSALPVRIFYRISAIWLGFLNLFFIAALLARLSWITIHLLHPPADPSTIRPLLVESLYALAVLAGIYGLINCYKIRIRRISVQLPNLPASWRGRRAVLASDLHLGAINNLRFCRRVVAMIASFQPDVVFLPGDLFDGTHADLDSVLTPFQSLTPPHGIFFSTGNHEEFTAATHYINAITRAGIRVLANESVSVDGVRIAGVLYQDSAHIIRMKAFLDSLQLGPTETCILLNHAPVRLPIVEQAGVSLQLSGHTHGGQIIPFTWLTRRIFGRFTSGFHHFGKLLVYTSTGAGSWGPPMRIGSVPEMVVFEFTPSDLS